MYSDEPLCAGNYQNRNYLIAEKSLSLVRNWKMLVDVSAERDVHVYLKYVSKARESTSAVLPFQFLYMYLNGGVQSHLIIIYVYTSQS
jgi:hypothetical protein